MTDFTAEISAAMAAGMAAENRRREVASQTPGLGAKVELPPPPSGPGVGVADVPLPVIGESHQAAPYAPQRKSYGPPSPVYADDLIGGVGYAPGGVQTALRAAGERVFAAQDAAGRADVTVVSPPARPSLLARLFGRLRRH
jgi:hypothetical protein